MTKARKTDVTKPSAEDMGFSAIWFVRALRKHWPMIVAAVILAAGISLLYTRSLPRIYESASLIEFDPDAIRPLPEKSDPMRAFASFWDNHEYYETQYKIIVSERVLGAVVRDLGLQTDPAFLGYKPATPAPLDEVTASLAGRVRVDPVKGSRLVSIRVEDTDPKLARRLCDALTRTYIAQNLENTVSATGDAVVWLNTQLDHFKNELESNEDQLHDFKKRNDLPSSSIDEVSKMIRLEMQAYDEALTHTRTRKQELLARRAELEKVNPQTPDVLPASELLANSFLQGLRTQYQGAIRERAEFIAEGKGENHPSVKKLDEKIIELRQALMTELKNILAAVESDLAIITRQEKGEAALYEAARQKAVELNLKELEYHRIDRTRAENEKLYETLLEQTKETDLARMMNVNNIRLVDAATDPKGPVRPRESVNLGVGVLVGLFLGLGLALIREQLDSSLKTPADVEQELGVTFLGLLPELSATEEGGGKMRVSRRIGGDPNGPPELIVHRRPLSGIAEAARSVRTNLMFMNPDRPYRRLLITSAAPSEGKTTVATSIAISFAQGGQRVCIVDCDMRRPRLHRIFDRVGDAGVTNVLMGDATVEEVAQPTVVDNLWCIPCGPTPPNPGDVLHSERFKSFIAELSERFDRVIIDSPPLVAVSDAAAISSLVDGTVFVVRAFTTARALARQGLRGLLDVDAPVLGAVLNAVNLRKHEYSYYQYYYYKREGYRPPPGQDPPAIENAPGPPN